MENVDIGNKREKNELLCFEEIDENDIKLLEIMFSSVPVSVTYNKAVQLLVKLLTRLKPSFKVSHS